MELTNDNKENSLIIKQYIDIRIKEERKKVLRFAELLILDLKKVLK